MVDDESLENPTDWLELVLRAKEELEALELPDEEAVFDTTDDVFFTADEIFDRAEEKDIRHTHPVLRTAG